MLAIIGAQPDRLVLEIVRRAYETHGLAFRAHQDRVGDCVRPLRLYTAEERTVANPGCAKDNVISVRKVVGEKDAIKIVLEPVGDEFANCANPRRRCGNLDALSKWWIL